MVFRQDLHEYTAKSLNTFVCNEPLQVFDPIVMQKLRSKAIIYMIFIQDPAEISQNRFQLPITTKIRRFLDQDLEISDFNIVQITWIDHRDLGLTSMYF